MDQDRKKLHRTLLAVAFGVALFVGLWHLDIVLAFLKNAFSMVSFFVIGLCIAFILNNPLRLIEQRLMAPLNRRLGARWESRGRRPVAVALTVLLLLALVNLVVFMVIPEMGQTFSVLAEEFPAFTQRVSATYADFMERFGADALETLRLQPIDWNKLGESIVSLLNRGASSFVAGTVSVATSFVSAVVNFVIGIILSIYVLLSKEKLARQAKRTLYAFLPHRHAGRAIEVASQANIIFGKFLTGQFTEALILGVLCFLGMSIFGFQFAPVVSVLVALTSFIPIFGAFIGVAVGAFMILVNQGIMQALGFILFFLVLQQIEGNLIYPHVVGKSVMLPGLWVLTAVTLGGNLAGILGMLVSVPLCSLLYALLREAVNRRNAANPKPVESEEGPGN